MTFDRFGSDEAGRGHAYSAMLASISDVVAVLSVTDGEAINRFKSANVRKIFGWEASDLVGRPTFDIVHPDDQPGMRSILAELLDKPESVTSGECRYLHADGSYRWIRFTAANKLTDPVLQGILLNYRDITEERQARERFRSTFEVAPVGMILADSSNTIVEANRAAERLLGYGAGELTGMNGRDIIHPEDLDRDPIEAVTGRVLQGIEVLEIENRFRTRSEEYIDVSVRVGRIDLEDQSVTHIVQFYDITRRKEAEQRVQLLLKEKELLLREVHHRIKNDLSLVQSLLSTQAQTVDKVAADALRAAGYRVGVMARVYERFRGLGGLGNVRITDVIGGLVEELRAGLVPEDVTVRNQMDQLILPARLAVSLGIIVNELITNAVKYAFSHGEKEITVHLRVDADDGIHLAVGDTGNGFPADVLTGERVGYGLTIAKALVDQHQGTMALSNAGGGIVEIFIPAAGSSAEG